MNNRPDAAATRRWDSPELSRWSIGEELGHGGMGEVYAAADPETGAARALKIMRPDVAAADPAATGRFLREVRTSEALDHPNVVRAYASGAVEGGYFLVMEFCALGSVADLVRKEGPLPAETAAPLFLEILDGLHYAHHANVTAWDADDRPMRTVGIVHRDIKPQNILLSSDQDNGRTAKIADFGLAKAFVTAGLSKRTETGTWAGTPAYMPCEQVLNFKYVRPSVDVWAAAATMYYTLTGFPPRDLDPGRDPWRAVCEQPPVPVSARGADVPPSLAALLDRALDDARGLAFGEAADLRAELSNALQRL